MLKTYYHLTKPGIIYGNAISTIAGFFLASQGHPNWFLLLATLIGISLVIASACVVNNVLDRDIDDLMERTRHRALVQKTIPTKHAVIYGIILGLIGFLILFFYANHLTAGIGFIGWFVYVVLYTPLKRRSIHGTLIGAIAGAVPPVVGYCAVTNNFDHGALLLFLILAAWQMPHFYSIAIYRLNDYQAAHIPVLPAKKGVFVTKINIMIYIMIFIITTILLTVFHYTGYIYLTIVCLLGLFWLWFGFKGFKENNNDIAWARKMFFYSLVILLVLCATISIDSFIH
jgi:protoheme IX farnesyltransferase